MENKETETGLDYKAYVEKLAELSRTEPEDLLKEAIQERLSGGGPPLMPSEGNLVDVLIHAYNRQRKEGDARAMRRLRKLAVDLFLEALRSYDDVLTDGVGDSFTRVKFLGQMIAWFEVKKDNGLSLDLADKLLGFLTRRLPTPIEKIMSLDGMVFETAVHAFDLWLASISWQEAFKWPPHVQTCMERLYKNNLRGIQTNCKPMEIKTRLALLGFRAVLRCNPFWTGKKGLPEMLHCLSSLSKYSDTFVKRWWGLCHELAIVFKRNPNWRVEFIKGMAHMDDDRILALKAEISPDLIKRSLEYMNMRDELKRELHFLIFDDLKDQLASLIQPQDIKYSDGYKNNKKRATN